MGPPRLVVLIVGVGVAGPEGTQLAAVIVTWTSGGSMSRGPSELGRSRDERPPALR